MSAADMVTVQFRMTRAFDDELRLYARREKLSVAEIVRRCVTKALVQDRLARKRLGPPDASFEESLEDADGEL